MRVLLVEDSESDALLIRELLAETTDAEIDLEHVERLSDGIRWLEEEFFDALLLDLSLPDSSGLETFDRAHRVAPDVPIVVVTGLVDETRAAEAATRGAQDYLVKNELTGRGLRRALRYAVERQRLLHEMGERIKERDCLYRVNAALRRARSRPEAFRNLVEVLPAGWQYPELTRARICWRDREFASSDFRATRNSLTADLRVGGEPEGTLEIVYLEPPPKNPSDDPFLDEEYDLIREVARAVGEFLRTEQQQEEQRRLATAIEQSGDPVLITDPDGEILYVNPAFEQTTGWSAEEAVGRTPRILKSGQHDDAFYRDLWQTISNDERWNGRFVNRRQDGTLYRADTTISPVRDASGEIVSFVAVQRDVTKEAELEEQLRQSQKLEAVGQLAGGVAHDFNNLLTVINGNAELILTRELTGEVGRESVEQIRTAGERAADLTRQLLAFSRKQVLETRPLDLARLVERFQKMIRRLIREEISLKIQTGRGPVPVEADAGSLEQVLLNLVVNARDAITDTGTIEITVTQREIDPEQPASQAAAGSYACLTVRDDGAGMRPEVLERAFEPFFTTKEEGKGSGLGLATVYGIVRQMRGFVTLHSAVGGGTTVEVLIPESSEADLDDRDRDAVEQRTPEGSETILLVEDDEQVLEVGKSILRGAGYAVLVARDGQDALERLSENGASVDLVITDVVMPRLGGVDLAERLLETSSPPKLLLLTGYAEEAVQRRIVETGLPVLNKPFSPDVLLRRIRELLDSDTRR